MTLRVHQNTLQQDHYEENLIQIASVCVNHHELEVVKMSNDRCENRLVVLHFMRESEN